MLNTTTGLASITIRTPGPAGPAGTSGPQGVPGAPGPSLPVLIAPPSSITTPVSGITIFLDSSNNNAISYKDSTGAVYSIDSNRQVGTGGTITSVSIFPSAILASVGVPIRISAIVTGTGHYADTVLWTVSDQNKADVTRDGVVIPTAVGLVTITATSTQDNSKHASTVVTIIPAWTISSISLSANPTNTRVGAPAIVSNTISGSGPYPTEVVYVSSDPGIVAVDGNGVATAGSEGVVTITAYAVNGTNSSISMAAYFFEGVSSYYSDLFNGASLDHLWKNNAGTMTLDGAGNCTFASGFNSYYYNESIGSAQLSGIVVGARNSGDWVGVVVRGVSDGSNGMTLINYGNDLMLYPMNQITGMGPLATSVTITPLSIDDKLEALALGKSVHGYVNGVLKLSYNDLSVPSSGSVGIATYASSNATTKDGEWFGGDLNYRISLNNTDGNGIEYYDVISTDDVRSTNNDRVTTRVLRPTSPSGLPHSILLVLPVEPYPSSSWSYGDAINYFRTNNWHNTYNCTIVEPEFNGYSWYADSDSNSGLKYESKLVEHYLPWVMNHLATGSSDKVNLIGFSKSGVGGMFLLLRHHNLFNKGAFWDFPFTNFTSYTDYGADNYGSQINFANNYEPSYANISALAVPFTATNRIWIGGYQAYPEDVDAHTMLASLGIQHTYVERSVGSHNWDPGTGDEWVPGALAFIFS